MQVVIAGGHGKIALRLAALLRAHGDEVRSLIRNSEHEGGRARDGRPGGREDGSVPRDDVAAVVHAALHDRAAVGRAFDLASGETPIGKAVAKLVG